MGHDNKVGSIEKGKVADMIILDRNLFEIPATQIGEASILKSIFNGAVVFDASVDPTGEEELEEEYDTELDLGCYCRCHNGSECTRRSRGTHTLQHRLSWKIL